MIAYALLAFFNGWLVGASRAINGRLAVSTSSFNASLWNNIAAFLLMVVLLVPFPPPTLAGIGTISPLVYLGGVAGALFVALNSFVLPRLGTSAALSLVIAGQMLGGIVIDFGRAGLLPDPMKLVAILLIGMGATLASLASQNPKEVRGKTHASDR